MNFGSGSCVLTASYTYSPNYAQLTSVTDPLSNTTTITRDSLDQATSITDALGHSITLGNYDASGRVGQITDALGNVSTISYRGGDPASVADPLGRSVTQVTDTIGRAVAVRDALANESVVQYDGIWGPRTVTDPLGNQIASIYDANGNTLQITDALGSKTAWSYDDKNRIATVTDPLLNVATVNAYDGMDNPLTVTDRKGQVSNYGWDAFAEPASANYADGSSTTYAEDPDTSALTSVSDSVGGTISRSYDAYNRLQSETTPQGVVSYTYDNAGRRATMNVPNQTQIVYTWDDANRLIQITQGSTTVSFGYDSANRRTSVTLPNGVLGCYYYDNASELVNLSYMPTGTMNCPASVPASGYIGNLTYSYDGAGRVATRGGTLFQSVLPSPVTSGTYDAANRLTSWVTPSSGASPSYDANGNLINDGWRGFTWDARNRLTSIAGGPGFTYDGVGRRQSVNNGGTSVSYLYDGANPVQEQSGGSVQANLLTGAGIDERFTRTEGATSNFLDDGLGSIMALTDGSGVIQTSYGYDPYGVTAASGAASDSTYQYTGRENDGTGLYYYRARYYNPAWGRFISQDPAGFGGGDYNLYRYVGGDLLNGRDPSGLTWGDDAGMFWQWVSGTAPANTVYGPLTNQSYDMMQSQGVQNAIEFFLKKNAGKCSQNWAAVTNYDYSFGLQGLADAGLNSTQQFVGSFSVNIIPAGGSNINISVYNTTSMTSFFYGIYPNWANPPNGWPMGNESQEYDYSIHLANRGCGCGG